MTIAVGQLRNLFNKDGLTPEGQRSLNDLLARVEAAISKAQKLQAPIEGRTEPIQTTVQALNTTGNLKSTDNIAADGVGSPLAGGRLGRQALDDSARIVNSFHNNQLNVTSIPTSSTTLSNDGVSTAIVISSHTLQYGAGNRSNNLGSVDPGSFGLWAVYYDDPTYTGGAVIYQVTSDLLVPAQSDGRVLVGTITTVLGTPFTGGGHSGGTGGGGGGHGYSKF
jgi:hypothetical protein